MGYRLYILSIRDLLDEKVRKTALTYLDSHRLALVDKYKKEQDRLRAIAAGLLLQVGFLELVPDGATAQGGAREIMLSKSAGDDVSSAIICLEVQGTLQCLQDYATKHATSLPVPLSYEYGTHGKPSWERRCIDEFWGNKGTIPETCKGKKFPHFNLSHSGEYVVLAIADISVGVDIQMERECDYPGGYKAFSRMEAFVKCTGDGIANGREKYEEMSKILPKYDVFEVKLFDEILYNIVACKKSPPL